MEKKTIKVVAAIIRKDNTVFATQRGYGDYKDWWEFPGGKIEPGETPEAALAREIKEELDSEIAVEQYLTTVEHDVSHHSGARLSRVPSFHGLLLV